MPIPTTAAEAVREWQEASKYVGDPDPGATSAFELFTAAHRVTELAKKEGLALDHLVPDAEARRLLEAEADEFRLIGDEGPDY